MTDTDRLAELAAAATPGPWVLAEYDDYVCVESVRYDVREVEQLAVIGAPDERNVADAAFIAACDPATIRALVDDNRELRAAAEALVVVLVENGYAGWPETQDLRAALHREDGA